MKIMKFWLIAISSTLLITACNKNGNPDDDVVDIPAENAYTGTFSVAPGTPMALTLEGATVNLTIDTEALTADIFMNRVSFNERMPEVNILIPGVTLAETEDGYTLSGDGIVPEALGGLVEDYMVTGLTGTATAEELTLSMACGGLPLGFSGTKTADAE